MDLLFELARADQATLILITHDMALAERCDRILRIADGLLVGDERRPWRRSDGVISLPRHAPHVPLPARRPVRGYA